MYHSSKFFNIRFKAESRGVFTLARRNSFWFTSSVIEHVVCFNSSVCADIFWAQPITVDRYLNWKMNKKLITGISEFPRIANRPQTEPDRNSICFVRRSSRFITTSHSLTQQHSHVLLVISTVTVNQVDTAPTQSGDSGHADLVLIGQMNIMTWWGDMKETWTRYHWVHNIWWDSWSINCIYQNYDVYASFSLTLSH